MQDNRHENSHGLVQMFNPREMGESLHEVAVDLIKSEQHNIESRWFHSAKDADFFLWKDEAKNIIKQQVTYFGQLVEWNVLEGLRTGLVVEEETGRGVPGSALIRYDATPQSRAIGQAVEIIGHIKSLNSKDKVNVIANFTQSPHFSQNHWLKQLLTKLGLLKNK